MTFDDLNLSPPLLEAIGRLGFKAPTDVQAAVIPRLLKNEGDMVALAQTGTGKTAAFGLPILDMLDHARAVPQALVLCPTRELCVQITRDLKAYGACMPAASMVAIYGGTAISSQLAILNRGVQIIVATPGRMLDVLRRKAADLSHIERVILDEADEMLNMGFRDDLEAILEQVPDAAHTLLFSATMPRHVATIASRYMTDPEEITIGQRNAAADAVTHECYMVHERDRYAALKRIADFYPNMYAIIFCRTRHETQTVADRLVRDGYSADSLHGDLSQAQRDRVMGRFRSKGMQLLVATDVAARGLDVNDLTHVINYNLPDDPGSYTHRSGRTGRAGKAGVSIIIINMREKGRALRIERTIRQKLVHRDVPNGPEICEARLLAMIERMKRVDVDHQQISPLLPGILKSLADMTIEDVITRFVSLEFNNLLAYYRNAQDLNPQPLTPDRERARPRRVPQREQPSPRRVPERQARPRHAASSPKAPAVDGAPTQDTRMFVNLGSVDGMNARKLAGLVAYEAGGDVPVRRIDVMKKYSFIDVPGEHVNTVVLSLGAASYHGRQVRVEPVEDQDRSKRFSRTSRRKEQGRDGGPRRPATHPGGRGKPPHRKPRRKGKHTS